jgi:ribosomal protein L24
MWFKHRKAQFVHGDRVVITRGDHKGFTGRVERATPCQIYVFIEAKGCVKRIYKTSAYVDRSAQLEKALEQDEVLRTSLVTFCRSLRRHGFASTDVCVGDLVEFTLADMEDECGKKPITPRSQS